jgi:hypothetical protein
MAWKSQVRFPDWQYCSLLRSVQINSEAHQTSYQVWKREEIPLG